MNLQSMDTLEYVQIKENLGRFAVSFAGKELVGKLEPMTHLPSIRRAMEETGEAKELLERGASVPLPSLEGMEWIMSLMGTGYLYTEQDFTAVGTFLNSCTQLRKYMAAKEGHAPRIGSYASSLLELRHVREEIDRCIRFGAIDDGASKTLEKIRKRLTVAKERLHKKIEGIMTRHKAILQENIYSMRNGRYVIPVKREYHKQVKGSVLDQSTSGQTVFVEPEELAVLQGEMDLLLADEAREEAVILSHLTMLVEQEGAALRLNIEVTGTYDFIFAKAKFARTLGARAVAFNESGLVRLQGGRHPMLRDMVPISLEFGRGYKSLIVTGPNTGGKTVVLKTLGLLTLMAQSGLLIPVEEGSEFTVFSEVMSVIGDGQSLAQSLSTFSAQIKSIQGMLRSAGKGVLLLIDELAAGTDPGEGIALSTAILEALNRRGANVIVTTHFNELKVFAAATPGFENARMEFDKDTLQPLYRLTLGVAGESYALQIAEKLGIDPDVITRSREILEEQRPGHRQHNNSGLPLHRQKKARPEATGKQAADQVNPTLTEMIRQTAIDGKKEAAPQKPPAYSFEIGDAVYVSSLDRTGIVFAKRNGLGMVGVMIQQQKMFINHKRLRPYISKEELYPEEYDFDIIFESKENRKKKKLMSRKHVEGISIVYDGDDN